MATRNSVILVTNDTDAHFRLWINEFHNAITGFGWVQTSDTGQINFSTVTHPTAADANTGYAMYRMNDSFQSSAPVYLKVEFGSTSSLADRAAIRVQISNATDGAGNLTGNVSALVKTQANASQTTTAVNVRSAGNSGSFRISAGIGDSGSHGFCLVIERDKDASGNDTALGVSLLTYYSTGGNAAPSMQFIATDGSLSTNDSKWWSLVHAGASQNGGIGVVRPQLGRFRNPLKTVVVAANGDFTNGGFASLPMYGVNRTFVMISPSGSSGTNINGLNTACKIGLLWE